MACHFCGMITITGNFTSCQSSLIFRIIFQFLADFHRIQCTEKNSSQRTGNGNLQDIEQRNIISGKHTEHSNRCCRYRAGSNSLLRSDNCDTQRTFRTNTCIFGNLGNNGKNRISHMSCSCKKGKKVSHKRA